MAVGQSTGEATPFQQATVQVDGTSVQLASLPLHARYEHEAQTGQDCQEYVVPVEWMVAVPKDEAFWVKGMFAKQHSACKLRDEFTLEKLRDHFGIDD